MKTSCSVALVLALCASATLAMSNKRFAAPHVAVEEEQEPALAEDATPYNYVPGLPGGFKCTSIAASSTVPTDARSVRFADIKVVAALGDSLTAANGVLSNSVPEVLKQFRGLSWSIGGDKDINTVLTVPNILKRFNSKVYGFSIGSSYSEDTPDAFYNVARAGNTAADMPPQATKLVSKVTADKKQNDWKLITMFIGGNDVCQYCGNKNVLSPANYKKNIQTALDNFYNSFRNTIVNLAGPIDMTEVSQLPNSFSCSAAHRSVCGCIYNTSDPGYATRLSREYITQIEQIISESATRYTRKDFAVTYHPQYTRITLPRINGQPDLSYFAPDCFHFSQKGQETAAITLWNNMLKAPSARATTLQFDNRNMNCPTDSAPYIRI